MLFPVPGWEESQNSWERVILPPPSLIIGHLWHLVGQGGHRWRMSLPCGAIWKWLVQDRRDINGASWLRAQWHKFSWSHGRLLALGVSESTEFLGKDQILLLSRHNLRANTLILMWWSLRKMCYTIFILENFNSFQQIFIKPFYVWSVIYKLRMKVPGLRQHKLLVYARFKQISDDLRLGIIFVSHPQMPGFSLVDWALDEWWVTLSHN